MKRTTVIVLAFASVFLATESRAQWQANGTLVCGAGSQQQYPAMLPDGSGGAIVTWQDHRASDNDVYAQRISVTGLTLWTLHGVPVCTATGDQGGIDPIVSDGAGGAIIAWIDTRAGNNDVYAQRINSNGVPQWTANGVALCTNPAADYSVTAVSDGAGGAIFLWGDARGATGYDVYAQRVNSVGTVQWTANGVVVSAAAGDQSGPWAVSDGSGGVIATWWDSRSGAFDVYAQRLNGSGSPQWLANGVALCTQPADQAVFGMTSDGTNGAILVWSDNRAGNTDVYAQRVNGSGVAQWTVDGVPICTNSFGQSTINVVSDGASGAIVAFGDARFGNTDVFAQRINASGATLWSADGIRITSDSSNQSNAHLAADGSGGAIMYWYDQRSGNTELYEQHLNAAGATLWASGGAPLITFPANPFNHAIVADGNGGALCAWEDYRGGGLADIFAQRVDGSYGYWGYPEPVLATVKDVPKDNGGRVAVNWTASQRDVAVPSTIGYYSIWRAADVAPFGPAQSASNLVSLRDVRSDTKPGARMAASGYYWELVGTQTAFRFKSYSYSTATRADSVLGNQATEYFMVAAHDVNDGHIAFASNVLSGHSVDNLAPAAPLALIAQRIGNYVHLRWNRVHVPDMRDYSVYRKTSSGVTPVPMNFLASADDTVLTDASPPASAIYYIVTAYDVHNNQSAPSNEAVVAAASGVGNLPPITGLIVLQNRPNPFTATSSFDMGLAAPSKVKVEVFDIAGRRVASRSLGTRPTGWQTVALEAKDDVGHPLASGVYFYRVHADGQVQTRKLIIAR